MSEPTLRLDAWSLWSKFGFSDGDRIGETFMHADGFFEAFEDVRERDVLILAVKRYLLPAALGPVEVELYATCHNPIRAKDYDEHVPDWADKLEVEVPYSAILAIAQEVREFGEDGNPTVL